MHGRATTAPYLLMVRLEVGSPTPWWDMEPTRGLCQCSVTSCLKALKKREKLLAKMKITP